MEVEGIRTMVESGVKLGPEQREFLIGEIFQTKLKHDDPKYDDWNNDWLDSLSDDELVNEHRKATQ